MENVDLIKRERSEIDQREVFIHLTEKSENIKPEQVMHLKKLPLLFFE